jgi:hypothetical protein
MSSFLDSFSVSGISIFVAWISYWEGLRAKRASDRLNVEENTITLFTTEHFAGNEDN